MSSRHYRSEAEGIMFSVFYDKVEIDEILSSFAKVAEFLQDCGLPMVYWIGDTTAADVSRQTLFQAIEATLDSTDGSGGDSRVIPLIIMDESLFDFFMSEFRNRYSWTQFPFFKSPSEAYEFVKFVSNLQGEGFEFFRSS